MGLFDVFRRGSSADDVMRVEVRGPSAGVRAGDVAGLLGALRSFGAFQHASVVDLSGGDLSQLSEEQRAKLRTLGIDLDALLAQQDAAAQAFPPALAAAAAPAVPADDQLSRLERLAALHAQGVLTDDELQQQKRRILDGG